MTGMLKAGGEFSGLDEKGLLVMARGKQHANLSGHPTIT